MAAAWEKLFDDAGPEGATLKKEVKDFFTNLKNDASDFIKSQGEKLKLYLELLAEGRIDKEDFEEYVGNVKTLLEVHAIAMEQVARARAVHISAAIGDILLTRLIALI